MPRALVPMASSKASISSLGKPSGKVGKACASRRPAISQWPVVVSLPGLCSAILPKAPAAFTAGSRLMPGICEKPIAFMLGRRRGTALAILPRVLAPSSPYKCASGRAPAPTLSKMINNTFFIV